MATAFDPNLPYDEKRRMARAGLGTRIAQSVADFAADPGGIVADARRQQAAQKWQNVRGGSVSFSADPRAPGPVADLPEGVQASSVGGIYEGKRGLAGERVFSDNAYDPLLTDRSGGMVRRGAGDVAASQRVLAGTSGAGAVDNEALRNVPRYSFARAADPATFNAGARAEHAPGSRAWEQENQRVPTAADVDPGGKLSPAQRRDALATQIATNKQALAMSRVQRGVATGAAGPIAAPAGGAGAVDPLDYFKTVSDVQLGQAGEARQQRGQDIELQKANDERANGFFDAAIKEIQADERFANMAPADQAKAANIRAAIALEGAGIDPTTTTRGRLGMSLIGEGLAAQTNTGDLSTFVPPEQADLGRFNVRPATGLERIGNQYVVEGPSFAPDPASGRYVEVAPGTEGAEQNTSTSLFGLSSRDMPSYLAVGTGGDLGSLRALIARQRQKVAEYVAREEQPQGAKRRYAY